jgi:alpha-mannosidase
MNNYWFTNFRAYQEGAFSWGYQLTSTTDTTNTYATKYAWGERNTFPTRTFPAGKDELKTTMLQTLKISGSANVILINSRPAFNGNDKILLHLREAEGLPAGVELSSAIPDRPIKKMFEVNAVGHPVGEAISTIQLKPYEVKFIEVEF